MSRSRQRVQTPKYVFPVQPPHAYSVQPGTGYLERGYEVATGALHPGIDLNGLNGGDTDLGDEIYAVTDGVVVASGFYSSWGNIILLEHPGPGIWTMNAHCQRRLVKLGDRVKAGQVIGTIGKGAPSNSKPAGRFLAHLHFEVRLFGPEVIAPQTWPSAMFPNDRAKALEYIKKHYVNPLEWLKKVGAARLPVD